MAYERLTIVLQSDEAQALREVARQSLRRPPDQARYLLRTLLLGDKPTATKNANGGAKDSEAQRAAVQP